MSNEVYQGRVLEVTEVTAGSELTQDHLSGDTELHVYSTEAFEEAGGQVTVDGNIYDYLPLTDGVESLIIDPPLIADIEPDEQVFLYPLQLEKRAMVEISGISEDSILARVPHSLYDALTDTMREGGNQESVSVIQQTNGEWVIQDVLGSSVTREARYIDPEGMPSPVPTEPPVASPVPEVLSGSGAAVIRWPYVDDASAYDLYVSNTNVNAPGPDTFYMADVNSPVFVPFINIENRTPMPTDEDSYFALVARNVVGSAPASAWIPGRAGPISETILASSLGIIQNVVAELVQTQGLVIGGQTWNSETGLTIPDVLNFPPDNASAAQILADMVARSLTVQNNLLLQGANNEFGFNSKLKLASGVNNPASPPTVAYTWPQVAPYGSAPVTGLKGIAADLSSTTNKRWAVLVEKTGERKIKEVVNGVLTGVEYDFGNDKTIADIVRGTNCWYILYRYTDSMNPFGSTGVLQWSIGVLNDDFSPKAMPAPNFVLASSRTPRIAAELGASDKVHVVWIANQLNRLEATINSGTGGATITLPAKVMTAASKVGRYVSGVIFTDSIPGDASTRNLQVSVSSPDNSTQPHKLTNSAAVDVLVSDGLFVNVNGENGLGLSLASPSSTGEDAYAYGVTSDGYIAKYSKQVSWQNHELAFSWYDDNAAGGTHESMISPLNQWTTANRRTYLKVTCSPVAQPISSNTPNKHRVYASSSFGGSIHLQAETNGVNNYVELSEFNGSGATPPVANGFIGAGVDATVIYSDATDGGSLPLIYLTGDGQRGRVGPLTWDENEGPNWHTTEKNIVKVARTTLLGAFFHLVSGASTAISWDTLAFEQGGMVGSFTNPSVAVVAPWDGLYEVNVQCGVSTNNAGTAGGIMHLSVSGSSIEGANIVSRGSIPTTGGVCSQNGTTKMLFAAGDSIRLFVFHTNGSNRDLALSSYKTEMTVEYKGPIT